jgi:hypothetical protein
MFKMFIVRLRACVSILNFEITGQYLKNRRKLMSFENIAKLNFLNFIDR